MTTINLTIEIPNEELDNILSACFEGGSNYWIDKVVIKTEGCAEADFASEVIKNGGTLSITEDCNEVGCEVVTHELTKQKLLDGITTYAKKNKGINFKELDAPQCDLILQYALFKEQKYN